MYFQQRLKPAHAFSQSDQILRCPREEPLAIQNAPGENSDQTERMRRLI